MEEMSYVFLFTFFPLPLIFALVAASISHLLTTATLLFIELFYIGMSVVRADGRTYGHLITKKKKFGWLEIKFLRYGATLARGVSLLWSIASCQNRVSVDQNHMTKSRSQMPTHQVHLFFFKFSANQLLAFNWSQAEVYVFQLYVLPQKLSTDLWISSFAMV